MARKGFFKNYRVYLLATVAYMGSLLFGTHPLSLFKISN
jgi:hypothetical protein